MPQEDGVDNNNEPGSSLTIVPAGATATAAPARSPRASDADSKAASYCSGTSLVDWLFNIGLQLITPAENLVLARMFSSLSKEGAAAVALILAQRATLTGFLSATSRAESARISKLLGIVHWLEKLEEKTVNELVEELERLIKPTDSDDAAAQEEKTRLQALVNAFREDAAGDEDIEAAAGRDVERDFTSELLFEILHWRFTKDRSLARLATSPDRHASLIHFIRHKRSSFEEAIGGTFRAGLTVNFLESLVIAGVLYRFFEPFYLALGQPKDIVQLASPYIHHYAAAIVGKGLNFAASRAALGVSRPQDAFWINVFCSIASNLGAYFLFDKETGNIEIFADAATLSAVGGFLFYAALFCFHPAYQNFRMLACSAGRDCARSVAHFLAKMRHVAYQGAVGGLQSVLERLTIMATSIYLGYAASKEDLALFGVISQIVLWTLSAGLGFGVQVMNQSRKTWNIDRTAAVHSILMGLGIGVIFPLLTSISVAAFPEEIGEFFLAGNHDDINLAPLRLAGALAVGASGLDFLRIALGLILMSHDNPWAGAIIGLFALWADFGLGVLLEQVFGVDPLDAFSANDLVGGGISVIILVVLVCQLIAQPTVEIEFDEEDDFSFEEDSDSDGDEEEDDEDDDVAHGDGTDVDDSLLQNMGGPTRLTHLLRESRSPSVSGSASFFDDRRVNPQGDGDDCDDVLRFAGAASNSS